jgi:hypothetical protein
MAQVGLGGRVEELRISVRLEMDPCDCCWSACPWTRSLDLDLAFRALWVERMEGTLYDVSATVE